MELVAILIVVGLQRFLKLSSRGYQFVWIDHYYAWMAGKIAQVTKGHGLVSTLILVVPVLLVVSMVFALLYHLFGQIGYYMLSVVMLWYCIDARDLEKEPYETQESGKLLLLSYEHLFSGLFWYFVFGPVGLALSITVFALNHFLTKQLGEERQSLKQFVVLTQGVLDWVSVRLMGITFALVGQFGSVFKSLVKQLFSGIEAGQKQVVEWGFLALQDKDEVDEATPKVSAEAVVGLLNRALLVWLVLMAIIIIA